MSVTPTELDVGSLGTAGLCDHDRDTRVDGRLRAVTQPLAVSGGVAVDRVEHVGLPLE